MAHSPTSRYTSRRKEETTPLIGQTVLEWDKGTGIYARQSTVNQRFKNLASAEVQTKELLEFAYRQGAPRDARTVLYDENISDDGRYKAASGTLRIDQREGLSALIERIENDEVKVVVCFLVDRLFRDEFLIGPGQFMKTCKEHDCKVVLYTGTVYDFNLDWCQQQFFMESLAAANYLKTMRVRLYGNKMYFARKGLYDGRFISVGYAVDRRQYLPDNTLNPMWKRYIVYAPHAKVVLWLFQRYFELDGNLPALCREVSQTNDGYIFPAFGDDVEQENRKIGLCKRDAQRKRLPDSPRGFRISRSGITSILTNRDYLGEWHSEGALVQKQNHAQIVPDALFQFACDRLSGEGKDTGRTQPRRQEPLGALEGLLTSPIGRVYALETEAGGKQYLSYAVRKYDTLVQTQHFLSVDVHELDDIFRKRLVYWLEHMPPKKKKKSKASDGDRRREAKRKQIRGQIADVNTKLAAIEAALDTLTLPMLIARKEEDYEKLLKIKDDLERALNKPEPQQVHKIVLKYKDALALLKIGGFWQQSASLSALNDTAKALTTNMTLSQITSHWVQLDVDWLPPGWGSDRAYIYRHIGSTPQWSDEELVRLKELYPKASKDDLLQTFPTRTWLSISGKAQRQGIYRDVAREGAAIPETLTWQDWRFMQEQGLNLTDDELSLRTFAYWCHQSRAAMPGWLLHRREQGQESSQRQGLLSARQAQGESA
jgi:Resolvase, N terminal domain